MPLPGEKLHSIPKAFLEAIAVRIDPSTGWRLYKKGSHGVRLKTVKVGGRRMTSVEAVHRFNEAVTAAADGEAPKPSTLPRTSRQRESAISAAERELAKAGV